MAAFVLSFSIFDVLLDDGLALYLLPMDDAYPERMSQSWKGSQKVFTTLCDWYSMMILSTLVETESAAQVELY